MTCQKQGHQIIARELQHGELMHLLRVVIAMLDRVVFSGMPSWSRMKLMSLWIVFGVTSISAASVEQFGKRPTRMILWISMTRHIAGRLTPDRKAAAEAS